MKFVYLTVGSLVKTFRYKKKNAGFTRSVHRSTLEHKTDKIRHVGNKINAYTYHDMQDYTKDLNSR